MSSVLPAMSLRLPRFPAARTCCASLGLFDGVCYPGLRSGYARRRSPFTEPTPPCCRSRSRRRAPPGYGAGMTGEDPREPDLDRRLEEERAAGTRHRPVQQPASESIEESLARQRRIVTQVQED